VIVGGKVDAARLAKLLAHSGAQPKATMVGLVW
jgi:hypothetical protein